jgi:Rieske Fe-S protein
MSHEPRRDDQPTTRRTVLAGAGLAGAGLAGVGLAGLAGTLTACGANGPSSATAGGAASPAGGGSASSPAAAGAGSGSSGPLATTSEIPVGGGKIFAAQLVVVTQPSSGAFKAFSAICTHMGCAVDQVTNGTIDCPCHGSQFSIKDGAVVTGPALSPLPAKAITVTGDNITLG